MKTKEGKLHLDHITSTPGIWYRSKADTSAAQRTIRMFSDWEDGVKHDIPYLARYSEAQVEILVVVSKMILLHLLHIGRKTSMVETR